MAINNSQVITPGMAPSNQNKQISTVSQKELVEEESIPGSSDSTSSTETTTTGRRKGIVKAKFLENIETFIGTRDVADVVAALQDLHSRYKYLESQLTAQKQGLISKLPDIESALNLVKFLKEKKENTAEDVGNSGGGSAESFLDVRYNLSENIYAQAKVSPNTGKVLLWLGASVMLEYTYDEAETLLAKNLSNAEEQLNNAKEDSRFVRSQITTTEVNIARCHNYGVMKRQKEAEEIKNKEVSPED